MGYDDLKVIEAKKFLVAVTGGEQRNSTIEEALPTRRSSARPLRLPSIGSGTRCRRLPGPRRSPRFTGRPAMPDGADLPLVVGLGVVRPGPGEPGLRRGLPVRRRPHRGGSGAGRGCGCPRGRSGARELPARAGGCGDRPHRRRRERVDVAAATARGIAVVITPGSGSTAVAEGAIAMAMHLTKRFGRLTALVREDHWADRARVAGRRSGRRHPWCCRIRPHRATRRCAWRGPGHAVLAYDPVSSPPGTFVAPTDGLFAAPM